MKARKNMLRIASVIMFLHAAFHSIAAFTWKQAPDEGVAKVIDGMLKQTFSFGGRSVSLGLFYEGYGISMIFMLLLISAILWLLPAGKDTSAIKKIGLATSISLFALAATEWIYFFPVPAIFSFAAGLLTILAIARRTA